MAADGRACTSNLTGRPLQRPGSHSQLPGGGAGSCCATVSLAQAFVAVMVAPAVGSLAAMGAATTNIHSREYHPPHAVAAHLSGQGYLPRNTSPSPVMHHSWMIRSTFSRPLKKLLTGMLSFGWCASSSKPGPQM